MTAPRSWWARLLAVAGLGLSLLVAGCIPKLPGSGEPPKLYDLTPKSTFDPGLKRADWQLIIEVPLAPASLDTNRIALRQTPTTIEYFKGVSWVDRAPRLVQTLLVESFENSGMIVAVGRQAVGLRADYLLKPELREFQAEYDAEMPRVRVRLNLKLVKMPDRAIVANTTIEVVTPAAGRGMDAIVLAFDQALGKVMKRAVQWTLSRPTPAE